MKKRNRNKFLVFFYPEKQGYSVFAADFNTATSGKNKSEAKRMAGDLLNILWDLEEYKELLNPKNRKSHLAVNPLDLYYECTGERLDHNKGIFYRYITPKLHLCK